MTPRPQPEPAALRPQVIAGPGIVGSTHGDLAEPHGPRPTHSTGQRPPGGKGLTAAETMEIRGQTYRKDPARETCFRIVREDSEMMSFTGWSTEARRERLHRHMHNELGSLEIAAQMLSDFPEAPWELRMELARQCWDETRHVRALRGRLEAAGGRKGEFPVATLEWRVTCILDTLVARLAVQNRTFEAGQMDLVRRQVEEWREAGDHETAEVLDAILADEIQHVRFANRWVRRHVEQDRRLLMKVVSAAQFLSRAIDPAHGAYGSGAPGTAGGPAQIPEINVEDRRLAGFTEKEILEVLTQAGSPQATPTPDHPRRGAPTEQPRVDGGGQASRSDLRSREIIHHGSPPSAPPRDGEGYAVSGGGPGCHAFLFGPGPARDGRFEVRERWAECENLPDDHPDKNLEFLHRQLNEEINGLENSARCLSDFPEADWEIRMHIARQCADEARHALMFRRIFESRGGRIGAWPVMNFQYRIISQIDHLPGRLAVQNRAFEAEGIDAIRFGIDECAASGDAEMCALFEAQLADEIGHVRYANEWLREAIRKEPATAIRVARALTRSAEAFHEVMGEEGSSVVKYFVDPEGRLEAGFLPREVEVADELVRARRRKAGRA